MRFTIAMGLAAAASAAACDPKVDSEYRGEAILSIYGAVAGEEMESDDELVAYASWYWYEGDTDNPEGESESQAMKVTADYPFKFRIDIYEPPSKLGEIDGVRISLAWLYVLNAPYPEPGVGGFVPFYAMADRHMLVYLEDDAEPGSIAAEFLHGPLPAGFHVMEARPRADCSTSINPRWCEDYGQDDLYLAPDDLETEIPLLLVDVTQGVGGILPYPWLSLQEVQPPEPVPAAGG
jgi:hypothetical protein